VTCRTGYQATVIVRDMMNPFKILVVEDEAITALLLKRELQREGYEVCGPVATAEVALQMVEREHPHLILMDIRLAGDMDGIEAAEKIVAGDHNVPIIFMTGYSDAEIEARANVLQPAAYLVKPVTFTHIRPVITRLFVS
jgi:CheY-like chemotaxis protein